MFLNGSEWFVFFQTMSRIVNSIDKLNCIIEFMEKKQSNEEEYVYLEKRFTRYRDYAAQQNADCNCIVCRNVNY